nr:hypothetical protein CFP56_69161 [Quercus suber]
MYVVFNSFNSNARHDSIQGVGARLSASASTPDELLLHPHLPVLGRPSTSHVVEVGLLQTPLLLRRLTPPPGCVSFASSLARPLVLFRRFTSSTCAHLATNRSKRKFRGLPIRSRIPSARSPTVFLDSAHPSRTAWPTSFRAADWWIAFESGNLRLLIGSVNCNHFTKSTTTPRSLSILLLPLALPALLVNLVSVYVLRAATAKQQHRLDLESAFSFPFLSKEPLLDSLTPQCF